MANKKITMTDTARITAEVVARPQGRLYLINAEGAALRWVTPEGQYYAGDEPPKGSRVQSVHLLSNGSVVQVETGTLTGTARLKNEIERVAGEAYESRVLTAAEVPSVDNGKAFTDALRATYGDALSDMKALEARTAAHEVTVAERPHVDRLHNTLRGYLHALSALIAHRENNGK